MSKRQVLEGDRTCTRCGKTQPWQDFTVDRRDADGNVIRVKTRCRECLTTLTRLRNERARAGRLPMNGRERVPAPFEWVRTKCCAKCGKTKSWALYSPVAYWPDGQVRRVQSRCRACRLKDQKARPRKMTPERVAYLNAWKQRQRRQRAAERIGRGQYLAPEPFKAWLIRVKGDEEDTLRPLAQDAGVHPDTLGKVLAEDENGQSIKRYVSSKVVEAALCARGLMLADLYGHDLDEAA